MTPKQLLNTVEPDLYMARNKHSKSYATSRSKTEAELFLSQSGLKNDGEEAEVTALYSRKTVESLLAECRKQAWIDCNERMPEPLVDVLCYFIERNGVMQKVMCINADGEWSSFLAPL